MNSAWKGLAPWRGQGHASLRAGVPPLRPQQRLGAAPPNKKMAIGDVISFKFLTNIHSHSAFFSFC